jgi:hypothetical protein
MKRSIVLGVVLLVGCLGATFYLRHRPEVTSQADAMPGNAAPAVSGTTVAASRSGTALAGRDRLSVADPDEWFQKQSDEVKASVLMNLGADYGGKGSLEGYFLDLERRIAAGDTSAVMPAAELLRTCALLTGITAESADGANPSRLVSAACKTLPAREPDYDRALVSTAARKGVREAVLSEWGFPPTSVAYSRDVAVRRDWANGVAGRLEVLAGKGDFEAQILLGRAYLASDFGLLDYARAAEQYGSFLLNAPLSDPRREGIQAFLTRICSEGRVNDARFCG